MSSSKANNMVLLPPCVPISSGKEFRNTLQKPSNNHKPKSAGPRMVPAFTVQALQKNTITFPPPKCYIYKEHKPKADSPFRKFYRNGELPVVIEYTSFGKKLLWRTPVEKLDICYYLPVFLYGLSEGKYPFNFIVENGIKDLVSKAGSKLLRCIPQVIEPLKMALSTRNHHVIISTNKCIRNMVRHGGKVGAALVPYYRQILPVLSIFVTRPRPTYLDQVTKREEDLWASIEETLNVLEQFGGPDAYINIKYYVPNYESIVLN